MTHLAQTVIIQNSKKFAIRSAWQINKDPHYLLVLILNFQHSLRTWLLDHVTISDTTSLTQSAEVVGDVSIVAGATFVMGGVK